jgi:hypothetical protein
MSRRWHEDLGDHERIPEVLFRMGVTYEELAIQGDAQADNKLGISLSEELFEDRIELRILLDIDRELEIGGIQVKRDRLKAEALSAFRRCVKAERELGYSNLLADAEEAIKRLGGS